MRLSLTTTDLEAQECTATVQPATVAGGAVAERMVVTLSEAIGDVTSFSPAEQSGLRLAAPSDLPRIPLAGAGDAPQPIQTANEGNSVTIWINSVDALPGEHEFSLLGADGECQGALTIAGR